MDTEINSIDKSVSIDDINLDKVLDDEISINNLSNDNEINIDINNNSLSQTDAIQINIENDDLNKKSIQEDEMEPNKLPDINRENDINREHQSSNDVISEKDINNLPEINLEHLLINTSNDNTQIIDNELFTNKICLNSNINNEKIEDEYSLDINERIIHNHGFIEQEIFENKLNLDSEFNISKDLTIAHNLEFTNSNDELTKINYTSNDNINISLDEDKFKNINLDGLTVNNILDNNNSEDSNLNNTYVIQGTQFINGTIENSYILGSTLSNVIFEGKMNNINKLDYLTSPLNGKISNVKAGLNIDAYQCVECYTMNGNLFVRPTDCLSSSPFFGIAQNSVSEGGIVEVLTEGITYINVKKSIELPILKRVANQLIFATDNKNNIFKQNFNLNIEKDDIVVLSGSSNDILIGPTTKYFQFNNANINGALSVYKSVQINFHSGSYVLNNAQLQTYKSKKMLRNNEFITVLDIDSKGRVIGLLN